MPLFFQPHISEGELQLDQEQVRHALKVLRLQSGDEINLTDGKGNIYLAEITDTTKTSCHFLIKETNHISKKNYSIHIAIAPTKNIDRIEWFVEKATEIGIDEISFVKCKNSERTVVNQDRVIKKAISALRQAGQAWLPAIHPILPFDSFLENPDLKFIAHVDSKNLKHLKGAKRDSRYLVLIGPEGDFTHQEIAIATEKGFEKVSLGNSTLRTETAGLAACHILNLINT